MIKIKDKLDQINQENSYDIILVPNSFKKNNQYFYKIIVKWDNIRDFISKIKKEIFQNSHLTVTFE